MSKRGVELCKEKEDRGGRGMRSGKDKRKDVVYESKERYGSLGQRCIKRHHIGDCHRVPDALVK